MQNYEQAVFISYAWEGEREEIVNQIDEALQKRGVKIIRDKRELGYKASIKEFMGRIGRGNCVIVVVSDKYLRSPNCMFELVEIAENKQFHNRIFPIVLSDANIYDPVRRIEYVKYWEDKISELNNAMKNVGQMNLQGIRDDIDQYDRIRDKISGLTSILKDMNTLTPEMHQSSNFSILYDAIESSMKESAATPTAEVERATAAKTAAAALLYDKPGKISIPKHWVGRDDFLIRVNQLLDQLHKVLLTGMGGIGKTSLAQMLVEERLQAGSKPILWLEVGDEKVDVLIEALAEKCGDDKILSAPTTEAKKLALKELLENYQAGMLAIDDVRNLDALNDLLEAIPDKLPVLMTSRMSFETDDIVDVSELLPAEALELLEKTSGMETDSTNENAKVLCHLFGYHPLAIEIAGARIKEGRGSTPEKRRLILERLLERLKSNPMKLSSLRRGEIRPLLDDCVADLDNSLQTVFFALGKFSGNRCTPTLLAAFLGKSIEELTDALEALVLRNLVKSNPEGDFYYLHDLIFHYVQTVAGPDEQDKNRLIETVVSYLAVHRRHYELLGFDLANLLGIAEMARGIDLVKLVSYLTIGNFPLPDGKSYADQRGYSIGLIEQLDRAIEMAGNMGEELNPTVHYLLGKRGNAAFRRGEFKLAAEKYKDALLLSPNEERQVIIGSIYARTLAFCECKEESGEYFEAAKALAETLHDDELRSFVLEQQSWAAGHLKDYATALRVAEQQLVLAEGLYAKKHENYEELAKALMNFGSAKLDLAKEYRGDVAGVLDSHTRAKLLAEKHDDQALLAQAHTSLGEYADYVGDRDVAQLNFDQALRIRQNLKMTHYVEELKMLMQRLGYSVPDLEEEQNERKT